MDSYNQGFFNDISVTSTRSANRTVAVLREILRPRSVVDVGCGVGSWAAAFRGAGVSDVVGIDGDWVPLNSLKIPRESFSLVDLSQPKPLSRRFDLAVCLEVAEHLPESASGPLLELLTTAADAILFSAAIPGQGGTGHVNEQWPSYWIERFQARGYQLFDVVRPLLFQDPEVAFWYAQNLMIFARPAAVEAGVVCIAPGLDSWRGAPIVHPRQLKTAINSQRIVPREWLQYGVRQLIPDVIARLQGRAVRADPREFALGTK
jgi:SAM-dependent methyltransferase